MPSLSFLAHRGQMWGHWCETPLAVASEGQRLRRSMNQHTSPGKQAEGLRFTSAVVTKFQLDKINHTFTKHMRFALKMKSLGSLDIHNFGFVPRFEGHALDLPNIHMASNNTSQAHMKGLPGHMLQTVILRCYMNFLQFIGEH